MSDDSSVWICPDCYRTHSINEPCPWSRPDGPRRSERPTLADIRALVDAQAEDETLWAIYPRGQQPISEAYLQQELRRLHALIERASDV